MRISRYHGGAVEKRSFAGKSELEALGEPLIVNCTGVGAKALFGDPELTPLKGQITLIKPQPSVAYALDGSLNLYVFPRQRCRGVRRQPCGPVDEQMSIRAERRKSWKAIL